MDKTELTQLNHTVLADFTSFSPTLNRDLDTCEGQISSAIKIDSSETLTDDAIYVLYSLAGRNPYIRINSDSEIVAAIIRLKSWEHISPFSGRRNVAKIEFNDGTILLNRQCAIPKNLPAEAISTDNVAQFCIGMNLGGKTVSFSLLRHLIANRCVNILEYIIRNEKSLSKTIPPINLLLTALIEWPTPDAKSPLQVLVAIEETYPGTIKSARTPMATMRFGLQFILSAIGQTSHQKSGNTLPRAAAISTSLSKLDSRGTQWLE